jgi:carbamoyltransferase
MNILGISAFYHDSSACLIVNGRIIAAAQEERFTRIKQDPSYPKNAVNYCLLEGKISYKDLDAVVYYDKPGLTFKRLVATYFHTAPNSLSLFMQSLPIWLKTKLHIKHILKKQTKCKKILFSEHHLSHAASAFYPSPFEEAAIITVDGVGEYATTTIGIGKGSKIKMLYQLQFPDSLGLLYSAFTDFLGFKINSGEYKVMGLAPYGRPTYTKLILKELVDIKEDGSIRLNQEYFDYMYGTSMTNKKITELLGPKRYPETELTERHMDIAASLQEVTEIAMLKMAEFAYKETGMKNLCLAGGVALNCVANGKLLKESSFDNIWIQPAAGDAGGSLGAALSAYHNYYRQERKVSYNPFNPYLGPSYSFNQIMNSLSTLNAKYNCISSYYVPQEVAKYLSDGKIVGFFNERMEFGPRALGNRSILGDPRSSNMQETMNLKIKYRESFRPFAPSVLAEKSKEYFNIDCESPYMLLVANINKDRCYDVDYDCVRLIEKVKKKRSDIPAVTHLDYSARLHTVTYQANKQYYNIIKEFEKLTGYAVIVNTSFNVRGEPIVCTPEDAYKCFMSTEIDVLVIDNFILLKEEQPKENIIQNRNFELD